MNFKQAFHDVNVKRKLYFDDFMKESELNLMEIEILVFLNEYPECNTFTEVMKSKGYAKSYISKAITNLVEKEYIDKVPVKDNKKVFQLCIREKSDAIVEEYNKCTELFQGNAFEGITDDEIKVFEKVINKITENLSKE